MDFLRDASRPKALDPEFDSLLARALRWEIAPDGTLELLPLTEDQREQYDFVAVCEQAGRTLHLLDSRPVWAPGIPYIPSFLLIEAGDDMASVRPLGTFDCKPEAWTFDWLGEPGLGGRSGE
ncbi:MAG TPA: hypothetical protein VE053_07645 [Allosphingosinicella sp.]|nr:hypothetical protein [Allosphingosinicella sp.]